MVPAQEASNELADVERKIGQMTNRPSTKAKTRPALGRIQKVLVALDPSSQNEAPVSWAAEICRLFPHVRVTVVSVLSAEELWADYADAQMGRVDLSVMKKTEEVEAKAAFESARKVLAPVAKSVKSVLLRGFPTHEIARLARTLKPDLVVVGSHAHGTIERMMLGSIADAVKHQVKCHVLVAKTVAKPGPVLTGVDGSEQSRIAARLAIRIGGTWGQGTHILHVFGLGFLRYAEIGEDEFRAVIEKHRLPKASTQVHYALDFGNAAKQILKYAKDRDATLIVLGSRGMGAFGSVMLGGVSNRVSHESPVSCLFVKT